MKVMTDIQTDFAAVASRRDVMVNGNAPWKNLREQALAQFTGHGLPSKKKKTGSTPACGHWDKSSSIIESSSLDGLWRRAPNCLLMLITW